MHVTLVSGIDPTAPAASGTRSYVLGLVGRLRSRNVSVSLIARDGGHPRAAPIDYVRIHSGPSSIRFLLRLLASAPALPIPKDSIIHVQRPDDLLAFARRKNPKVCTLHGIPAIGIRRRKRRGYGALYALLERFGLHRVNRVIAVNEGTRRWYSERYPWLAGRLCVVPVAVDTERFRPMDRAAARGEFGVTANHAILYAGRLTMEKRVDALVRSMREVLDAELLVSGDGPEEGALRAIADTTRVRFLGPIPHEQMPVLLNAADVLVLPSEYEGLPTIALEALACGTPVVATPVGALPEIVIPGKTGWLIPSPANLASTLNEALPFASSLRGSCTEIVKPYAWDVVVDRLLAIYREAAA